MNALTTPSWDEFTRSFPFLAPLRDTPQDSRFHAEGDVATHTKMVVEKLLHLPEFQNLEPEEQTMLHWAAIFHDAGKAECTRHEEDGSITSRGHAKRSVRLLRHHLWKEPSLWPLDLAERETMLAFIRWHGATVHFLNLPSPEDRVVALSHACPLHLLSLLVEADMLGRTCQNPSDQEKGLQTNRLFRETAEDLGCAKEPWTFASNHARWSFFERQGTDHAYQAFDDTKFGVMLMGGLPGAGKDTWIEKNQPDWPVVSLDELRKAMKISPTGNQGAVIQAAMAAAKEHLRRGESFIWNATNITESLRRKLIRLFTDYGARTRLVWLEADRSTLVARNRQRGEKQVPVSVIDRLHQKLDFPNASEVHQLEIIQTTP